MKLSKIAIIGTGNLGRSIANGLVQSGNYRAEDIMLTRRRSQLLDDMRELGYVIKENNVAAVKASDLIIVAVEPQQIDAVLREIGPSLQQEKHVLISVVTGVRIRQIEKRIGTAVPIVRAMPNTAIAVKESMTCIAANGIDEAKLDAARSIFDTVGKTKVINEEEMIAATALGACGIAFFLRAIRAASQGGIEIGFHSKTALEIAAQTAKGAASLLLAMGDHPEHEIDKVTTPRGCTIAGLNHMEHEGFSSAMIKGITISAEKAVGLYSGDDE